MATRTTLAQYQLIALVVLCGARPCAAGTLKGPIIENEVSGPPLANVEVVAVAGANSDSGTTALYAAASFGKAAIVKLLLERGAGQDLQLVDIPIAVLELAKHDRRRERACHANEPIISAEMRVLRLAAIRRLAYEVPTAAS